MNKVVVQEAGYRISVTSWENDADNYNFKTITIESKEDASAITALCKLLRPSYVTGLPDYGNMYEPSELDLTEFEVAVAAIPGIKECLHRIFPSLEQDIQDPEYGGSYMDCVMDVLYDLGLTGSEYYYTRVCEKVEVHYFEEPVYAADVTAEFM
jgi:hypothetical protein